METVPLVCERDGASTQLTCVDCERPICPSCLIRTEVGLKCATCGAPGPVASAARRRFPWILVVGAALLLTAGGLALVRPGRASKQVPVKPAGSWEDLGLLDANQGTATAVVAGGSVVVAGGGVGPKATGATTVLDPGTSRWAPAGSMRQPRRGHQAVVLPDGRILVAGGIGAGEILDSAELYNPALRAWTVTGSMGVARLGHSLTVLPGGGVLAAGGTSTSDAIRPIASAEVYDPGTGRWSPVASMNAARFEHTATLVDGRVLMAGGLGLRPSGNGPTAGGPEMVTSPLASTERFDPVVRQFLPSGDLRAARSNHAAAVLPDRSVLVVGGVGGQDADRSLASVERFDPGRGTWSRAPNLTQARSGATATGLPDGALLVTGGDAVSGASQRSLASAELLDPAGTTWRPAASMRCPRSEQAAVLGPDGAVVVVGGDALLPGAPPQHQGCTERYRP